MRPLILLALLSTACGETQGVQVVFSEFSDPQEALRIEVQIARAPVGGCDELVWGAPLSDELGPSVSLTIERDAPVPMQAGDERFAPGEELVLMARARDASCTVFAAGCLEARAGEVSTVTIEMRELGDEFGIEGRTLPCVGTCDASTGACEPARCDGPESCGDGNRDGGDGCSAECEVEPGYRCPETGPCTAYRSCREYAEHGFDDEGLYAVSGLGYARCIARAGLTGWTQAGRSFGGNFFGWSSSGALGDATFSGEYGARGMWHYSDDLIATIQGPAPRVLVRGVTLDFDEPVRVSAEGCRYAHTSEAAGPCAVMTRDATTPGGSPPLEPYPDTLGVGDATVTTNDPARGFRIPAEPGSEGCTALDEFCEMYFYVR